MNHLPGKAVRYHATASSAIAGSRPVSSSLPITRASTLAIAAVSTTSVRASLSSK